MKKLFKRILLCAFAFLLITTPILADSTVGTEIISLGADLSEEQRTIILNEFNAEKAIIIEVTNAEEHNYLGEIISEDKIGNIAISSAKLTLLDDGSGIDVDISDNIDYITEDMYRNALITAGIRDADVEITAPFKVTGTGALTGILKAYESATGSPIPEEVKKIANEELVITSELSKQIGEIDTTKIVNEIKIAFSENMPENEAEAREIIVNISNYYNVNLNEEQINQLVELFMKMKNSNIDWEGVAKTAQKYSQKAAEFLSSEEGQSFLQTLKNLLNTFIDWITNLFR